MRWAESMDTLTAERLEIRDRQVMASFLLRESLELIGIEQATGQPVIWTGFHDLDWESRQCATGFWVRKSAHNLGFATEATNAMLRFAFGALGMRRVAISHAAGNEASRRVIEKLGFLPEGVFRDASLLPEGRLADTHHYARLDANGLPPLEVAWGTL